jgi:thioredoxin reductase (NADPH)
MRSLGIEFHNDAYHTPVFNEVTMETNVPGLYLAGVVCGGLKTNKWFIENSRIHAELIVKDILQRRA